MLSVLPSVLVALVFWAIGAVAYWRRRDHPAAQVHLLFTSAMAAYFALVNDYDFGAHSGPLIVLSHFLIGATAMHLGAAFPSPDNLLRKYPRQLMFLFYGPALFCGGLAALLYHPTGPWSELTFVPYMTTYFGVGMAWNLLAIIITIALLVRNALVPVVPRAGMQARLALYGASLAFLPTAVFLLIPNLLKVDPQTTTLLTVAMQFPFLLFPAAIAYAIVRTQLFDIDLVIKRTLQYTIVAGALGCLYFGMMALAGYTLQRVLPQGASEATNAVAAATVALAFMPLSSWTWRLLDRLFSRRTYNATAILNNFGATARRATEAEDLFAAFAKALDEALVPTLVCVNVTGLNAAPATLSTAELGGGLANTGGNATYRRGGGPVALVETLRSGRESIGQAEIGNKRSDLPFTREDRALFAGLCQQLALAVENTLLIKQVRAQERVAKELEIAHEVQSGLMPTALPQVAHTRLAAHNQAALEMGGDFYDFIPLQDGAIGIVLGDVSGKGVPAALLGAVCLSLFRAIAPHYRSPIETLQAINEVLLRHRASKKMFVAVTYVVYHPASGWAIGVNAGNPAPLLSGKPIVSKGLPLGALRQTRYCDFEVILEPGDTLVLFSDGLIDARNRENERFGDERFLALMAQHAQSDPADLITAIRSELAAFQNDRSLYDDLTILALRRIAVLSPAPPATVTTC
ncbi:MAG: SpoIIE family protein phosphatase [Cyanobacteria bacterium NC_groundwater_1444_Ag_S-0.65um_54_12]|nr:SpoIIE family protein phosphatase [Cyanobacteria bacterium NC_groundwater_1444_Ag_S-0.65um_54_12]